MGFGKYDNDERQRRDEQVHVDGSDEIEVRTRSDHEGTVEVSGNVSSMLDTYREIKE